MRFRLDYVECVLGVVCVEKGLWGGDVMLIKRVCAWKGTVIGMLVAGVLHC